MNMKTERYPELSLASYRRIYSRVPRFCVDVVIRSSRGVLLSRRSISPNVGRWYLPGGRVQMYETITHAAKRICAEELGLPVAVTKVLGVIEYVREPRARGFTTHSVSAVLAVQPTGGTLRGSRQAREVYFFKSPPRGTQPVVREFLLSHRLMRR